MSDARQIEADIYERLSKVIDPELGRSVTDLGMIAAIEAAPASSDAGTYDVTVHVELTVPGCPLSETITSQINGAVSSYPGAQLLPHIEVGSMSRDKLADLVADLKAERKQNPFSKPGVKTRIFAIASGKGGVGKSMVTSQLAVTLHRRGYKVGVMDADITGPSIPQAFGVHDKAVGTQTALYPCVSHSGIEVMSINLLLEDETDPVIWRGPVIGGVVQQFWTDVAWDVDYLFVDMPPGTGDVPLSVFQSIALDGIIVVTSPQELVSMVVEKAVKMAEKMDVPIVGVVENMSYVACPDCGKKIYLFGQGKSEEAAKRHNLPLLAQMPIDPKLAALVDAGKIEEFEGTWLNAAADALEKTRKRAE